MGITLAYACKRSHFKSLPRDQLRRPASTQPSSNHQAIELEDPRCRRSICIQWALLRRCHCQAIQIGSLTRGRNSSPTTSTRAATLRPQAPNCDPLGRRQHHGHVAVVDLTNPHLQTKPIYSPTAIFSSSAMTQTGTEAPTALSTMICPATQCLRPLSSIP
ncbi:hypothetical protein D9613_011570 [Agrocybe pediades]|uniref:Uncharacterized protein n=1 Tax=Agrocybe pediades TaxID=84607 RepID=A0A8H4QVD8_9AGAR|nr:hypothetical protein D9613_011570 [Agrocybe pediades]